MTAPDVDVLALLASPRCSRVLRAVWLDGLTAGLEIGQAVAQADRAPLAAFDAGVAEGRGQVEAEDAARWAGYVPTLQRVRRSIHKPRTLPPARTAEQIRADAAASWGLDGAGERNGGRRTA